MNDGIRIKQRGSIIDCKNQYGVSNCVKCKEVTKLLQQSTKLLLLSKNQIENKIVVQKIDNLIKKTQYLYSNELSQEVEQSIQIYSDADTKYQQLQQQLDIIMKEKIEVETAKTKLQFQLSTLSKRFESYKLIYEYKAPNEEVQPVIKKPTEIVSKSEQQSRERKRRTIQSNQGDRNTTINMISCLLSEMLLDFDYEKVFYSMGNKFEKILQCEQVVILRVKEDKLEWLNDSSSKKQKLNIKLKDKLIYACYSENQSFVINEPDKDILYHPKYEKNFDINIVNLLVHPIQSREQGYVSGILIAFNKKSFTTSQEASDFSLEDQRVAKMCANLAANLIAKVCNYESSITEKNSVNGYLEFIDLIFKHANTYMLQESIKNASKQLFDCERANFLFCDQDKQELYRNYINDKHQEHLETFSLQKGLAGFVANSLIYVISNNVEDDTRFQQSIDDPDKQSMQQTRNILTMPVLTSDEQQKIDLFNLHCPRGVLQLINKNGNKQFNEEDVLKVQQWCSILGRAHQVIKQLEQFNSLRSNFQQLYDATGKVMLSIDSNTSQMNSVLQTFLGLNNTITNSMNNRDTRMLKKLSED